MTYILWSSDFASYLEDYLMEKRCTWDNGSVWLKDRPCKIYVGQLPIFHGPLILPYIIVRLKLFLYSKKWHRPGVFVPLWALALVSKSFGGLCWGLTSQSIIFQSCRDGAIASWVINQYFRGVKCLAQGHNTAAVGLEPRTSRSGVRHSTTEPPRSPPHLEGERPAETL